MKILPHSICVVAMLFSLMNVAGSADGERAILFTGLDGKSVEWTTSKLKEQFAGSIKSVEYTGKEGKHHSQCVSLLDVLKAAGVDADVKGEPAADPKTKHFNLRLAVVIQGDDGYTTTFSLAELLPDIGNRNVWLALDEDDQPLPAKEAPAKLVAPDDAKPARWVHGVASISVIDPLKAAATQPAVK